MKRVIVSMLIACILFGTQMPVMVNAEGTTVAPSVISQAYSPTYENSALERHNRLIAEGWILVSVDVRTIEIPVVERTRAANGDVVIEGYKVVTPYYTQPIRSKTSYNSVLLDGYTSIHGLIESIVSEALPKVSWVPSAVGFISELVIELSSRSRSSFQMASTIRFYEIQVKQSDWPYWYTIASSERYEAAASASFVGYDENGSPWTRSASGSVVAESAHYGDYSYMMAKAQYHAELNDGTDYCEFHPDVGAVRVR